jgi:hypothetical protein
MRDSCITKSVAASPSDTVDEAKPGIGFLINVSGIVKVDMLDPATGEVSTISPFLAAGLWHPMHVKRVWSTGTDAAVLADSVFLGW